MKREASPSNRPNETTDLIVSPGSPVDTSALVAATAQQIAEALTGILAGSRADWIRSVGHIFQRARGGGLLGAFKIEWDRYRDAGRIKQDYTSTEQHRDCLQELLDSLDDAGLSERRFAILKKILLVAATEAHSTRDSVLPQQFMVIVRGLSAAEMLVLEAAFRRSRDADSPIKDARVHAGEWLREIAELTGMRHAELVELSEKPLVEKGLLSARSGNTDVYLKPAFRLTALAVDLLEFVARYEAT